MTVAAATATADVSPPGAPAFQERVRAVAKKRGQFVHEWFLIELDDHPGVDFGALVCDADYEHADLILQSGARIWDVRYDVDGRTRLGCDAYPRAEPIHPNDGPGIEHYQSHHAGLDAWTFGVRRGELVILSERHLDDIRNGEKEARTNWERRARGGKKGRIPLASDKPYNSWFEVRAGYD
jgi:hypothetical protein